jgi:hypothetical protein
LPRLPNQLNKFATSTLSAPLQPPDVMCRSLQARLNLQDLQREILECRQRGNYGHPVPLEACVGFQLYGRIDDGKWVYGVQCCRVTKVGEIGLLSAAIS